MNVVNIKIPPSLRTLTPSEIEQLAIHTINGHAGREILSGILGGRFETKRKVNTALSQIDSQELIQFYCDIREAGVSVDFKQTYFLLVETHRSLMAIKQ